MRRFVGGSLRLAQRQDAARVDLPAPLPLRPFERGDDRATYVGDLAVRGARVRPAEVALLAAAAGATHFRVLSAGDDQRLDIVLYRVERSRWRSLPSALRPAWRRRATR